MIVIWSPYALMNLAWASVASCSFYLGRRKTLGLLMQETIVSTYSMHLYFGELSKVFDSCGSKGNSDIF